ncbi:hypothetical protein MMC21_007428 [Puttea exsequens]|nr:hypothetical protein [Puttea exsequens]
MAARLPLTLLLRSFLLLPNLLLIPLSNAQSIGSFFTAIYVNGGVVSSNQVACSGNGQSGYCCNSGYSCGWDDAGKVACCESGMSCSGAAYDSGAASPAGQYQTSTWAPSSTWAPAPQQTTTVYQQSQQEGNVVPIVPVTEATLLTSYTPTPTTSYYYTPSSTYGPVTTTVTPPVAGATQATTATNCPNGYTTFTEANVGLPTRTVGCQVVINGATRNNMIHGTGLVLLLCVFGGVGVGVFAAF